jgi:hypothetical protein
MGHNVREQAGPVRTRDHSSSPTGLSMGNLRTANKRHKRAHAPVPVRKVAEEEAAAPVAVPERAAD